MRYRPGLPLVLKGVSFKVEGREKARCVDDCRCCRSTLLPYNCGTGLGLPLVLKGRQVEDSGLQECAMVPMLR
jgi:hypothetical protein